MLRKLKKLVLGVACAALFGIISLNQAELHNSYLRWEVGESVVQVLSPSGGGGTGFAIKSASGEDFIVTNKHVCEAAENGWMIIKQDNSKQGIFKRVVYKDTVHDLCLLQGDRRLSPLTLGSSPQKGSFNYIIGHPGLRQLTVSQGEFIGNKTIQMMERIEKKEQCRGKLHELTILEQMMYGVQFVCIRSYNTYSTTAVAYPGNSGSPVVNKYGNVIGVLFAGSTQEERDNFIVPLNELVRVLNKF